MLSSDSVSNRLELANVTVRFGQLLANDDVSFEVRQGEIHALLGENGAGKTTLMRVATGLIAPDEGEVIVDGRSAHFETALDAMNSSIGMVHQHFALIPTLSVVENMCVGYREAGHPFPDLNRVASEVVSFGERLGLAADPWARVSDLSVGVQQRVEILKALIRGAQTLILDEPTSVLTPQEADRLIETLRSIAEAGTSIVFISHKLREVMDVSDRITILRHGRKVGTFFAEDVTPADLAHGMIGRDVPTVEVRDPPESSNAPVVLSVRDASLHENSRTVVDEISFDVRAGEILGIAGVEGNGQSELSDLVTGMKELSNGSIILGGDDITRVDVGRRIEMGLAHIPADRHSAGLVLDMTLAENAALESVGQPPFSRRGWLQSHSIEAFGARLVDEFDVRGSPGQIVRNLSGGNQQKVLLGRSLIKEPACLVAVYPTRGLDVGAAQFIHQRLIDERERGCAVLLFSTELDEIIALSDRIAVIYEGKLLATFDRNDLSLEELGLKMAGHT